MSDPSYEVEKEVGPEDPENESVTKFCATLAEAVEESIPDAVWYDAILGYD